MPSDASAIVFVLDRHGIPEDRTDPSDPSIPIAPWDRGPGSGEDRGSDALSRILLGPSDPLPLAEGFSGRMWDAATYAAPSLCCFQNMN